MWNGLRGLETLSLEMWVGLCVEVFVARWEFGLNSGSYRWKCSAEGLAKSPWQSWIELRKSILSKRLT